MSFAYVLFSYISITRDFYLLFIEINNVPESNRIIIL